MLKVLPHEHLSQTFCIWKKYRKKKSLNLLNLSKQWLQSVIVENRSHLTSEPLEPLLPPPPPQHQQPDEDYNDANQHTGNGHHHLQTLATTWVVLTHIGLLHQRCYGTCAEVTCVCYYRCYFSTPMDFMVSFIWQKTVVSAVAGTPERNFIQFHLCPLITASK